jgi:putative oxidoreductase
MENVGACNWGQKYKEEAYLLLRIVTGIIFVVHGYDKVVTTGIGNVAGFFAGVNIPLPEISAFLVSYGELLGGIALILGVFTHWIAKLNVIIMLGAIFFVHLENGYSNAEKGYEYALLILVVNIVIATMGAGKYSVDAWCKNRKPATMPQV